MTNLSRCIVVCALMLVMVTWSSGMSLAQEPKVDAKIFEGTLTGADPTARVLTLKAGDREMQFTYTEQTEVVGPQKDGQPVAVKAGSKMKVYYQDGEKKVATKIEVTEP
jgi:hypothetical protein